MTDIYQASRIHVLCRPESWQAQKYPTGREAFHWEGQGSRSWTVPLSVPAEFWCWPDCGAVTRAEGILGESP